MFVNPAVAGNELYIGSCSGHLFALDASAGSVKWSYDDSADGRPPGQFHGELVLTDELVVVGTDAPTVGYLYAFDRTSGEVRWKLRFPHGVATDVLRRGESVLFASEVGDVARVDLASGDYVWRVDGKAGRSGAAEEPRPLDPLLAGEQLIVAWRSGAVDSYAAGEGRLLWRRDLGTTLNASPVLVGGDVVVGTFAGRLVRLRATDGEVVSSFEVGGVLYGDLVATPDCLLVLSARGGFDPGEGMRGPHALICLRADLAGARWLHQAPGMWGTFHPLADGGSVVAGVEDRVLALDVESGDLRWELAVRGLPRGLAVSGKRLFVGTRPGPILAFPWPRPARRTGAADGGDGAGAPSPR